MDAYREEYEKYEPELRIWPYILLGFIVPLVPFGCNIILFREGYLAQYNFLYEIARYALISSSYFIASYVIRNAKGSWALALNGALYFVLELSFWTFYNLKGVAPYPLGVPFVIALVPVFVFLLSYAFFAHRSRLPAWGTTTLLVLFASILIFVYILLKETGITRILHLIYVSLLFLLSLMTFFVTKRSEASPWYINVVLILFVFSSITVSPGFTASLSSLFDTTLFILKTLGTSYTMWLMVSFCFIYAGLGMKSCFKTLNQEEDIDELIVRTNSNFAPEAMPQDIPSSRQYSFPPANNRFREEDLPEDPVKEKEPEVTDDPYFEDVRDRQRPRESYRREERRERYYPNDDYYDDYRDLRDRDYYPPRERRERDDYYDDRYYRESRPYRRRDDDYYDDRRPQYEDDRYYSPRRERLDRREEYYLPRDERSGYDDRDRLRHSSSEDKWYDLLRGGLDDSFDSRDDYNR